MAAYCNAAYAVCMSAYAWQQSIACGFLHPGSLTGSFLAVVLGIGQSPGLPQIGLSIAMVVPTHHPIVALVAIIYREATSFGGTPFLDKPTWPSSFIGNRHTAYCIQHCVFDADRSWSVLGYWGWLKGTLPCVDLSQNRPNQLGASARNSLLSCTNWVRDCPARCPIVLPPLFS